MWPTFDNVHFVGIPESGVVRLASDEKLQQGVIQVLGRGVKRGTVEILDSMLFPEI